ncbi:hypothetical protein GCM10023197_46580 [Gordonia humi]
MVIGFVDESKVKGLLVACTVVNPADLAATRRALNDLRMKGQRRIHFTKESDSRRRAICSMLCTLDVEVTIYKARDRDPRVARAAALAAVVADLAAANATQLIIERDDPAAAADRATLYRAVHDHGVPNLSYDLRRPHEEPGLWISDAVAWCYTKDRQWRGRVQPLIKAVREV